MPKVAVLMTIYNVSGYLCESIDSLLTQDFQDWELIAIDDGSTDGSVDILKQYKDHRIRPFFLNHIGRTPALRYGLQQTNADYVSVLDADDIAMPGRLRRQVEFLDKNSKSLLVAGWVKMIDEHGREFKEWKPPVNSYELRECMAWINPFVHSSVMYRRQAALEAGSYPKEYVYAQDFALFQNLAEKGGLDVIGEYLCKLRVHSDNMTHSNRYQVALEGVRLMTEAGKKSPLSPQARRMNRCAVAKYEIRMGMAMIKAGDFFNGVLRILGVLLRNPDVLWTTQLFRSPFKAV